MTLDRGKTPKQARAEELEARGASFAAVADDYIRLHVPMKRKTDKDRREVTKQVELLKSRWGDRPIAEVRNRDVVLMIRDVIRAGADGPEPGHRRRKSGGPNAARHLLSTARALFNWAVEQDLYGITGNPVVIKAKTAHGEAPIRKRVLNDRELCSIWNATFGIDQPYGPLVRMLILTGQRLNEVAKSCWDEVDFDEAILTVPFDRMKGGDVHLVPLSPMAMELLQDLYRIEGQGHIFTTTRGASRSRTSASPRTRSIGWSNCPTGRCTTSAGRFEPVSPSSA